MSSSARASRSPGGSERCAPYSAPRGHYTVFMASVGLFQMRDCALIRFFKMLKKLEILPKLVSRGGSNVSAFGWDKNNRPYTIRAAGTPQRQPVEHLQAMDSRGSPTP